MRFGFQLRSFWFRLLGLGFFLGVLGVSLKDNAAARDPLLFVGAAVIGCASSAFFSRPDKFLLRGSGDEIYLIENRLLKPKAYHLADRETMNALGGKWHEVSHVSERKKNRICKRFCKGELSLKQAALYRPPGENSVFAVLNETRYGIPDQQTRERIWDSAAERREAVERFLPGRDLVSVRFWPPQDQEKDPKTVQDS